MDYKDVKRYGVKSWFADLFTKKKGYVKLSVPLSVDDWYDD